MLFSSRLWRVVVIVPVLAGMAACSSKKEDVQPPTSPVGMRWTADGAVLSTTSVQSQKGSVLSVAGTVGSAATSTYLALQIPNAVGTYTFGTTPASAASASYSVSTGAGPTVYYAGPLPTTSGFNSLGSGTIVVTTLTATNVQGTFVFTGESISGASKAVSNGTFNVGL